MTGRPRKDGPRHPSGQLVQRVEPTEQLLEKRRILVGEDHASSKRAGYPLGILRLRGVITETDHAAGIRYAALHFAAWSGITPGRLSRMSSHLRAAVASALGSPSLLDDGKLEERRLQAADELGKANTVLWGLPTRRPYDMLMNIAVNERPLRFMDLTRARTPAAWKADEQDKAALQEATDALARHWKLGHYAERKVAAD